MKRGAPDHPKMYALAEALGVRRPMAIGYIELLIHFTATYAPQGDIGRYSDKRIAAALDWPGDPQKLVNGLRHSGWIDLDTRARLVVHDWHEHAGDSSRRDEEYWSRSPKRCRRWQRMKAAGGEISPSTRAFIFERDGGKCRFCQSTKDLTIDHVLAISRGGTNSSGNLQALCRSCNGRKRDT